VPAEKLQLVLELLSRNKMGPGTFGAARDVDKVTGATDRLKKSTEGLAKTTTVSGEAVKKLGTSSENARSGIDNLDQSIAKVNQDLAFLHDAFSKAGTAADRMDISKGIRKAEADLKRLTKSRNFLNDLLPDPEPAARSFMMRLGGAIASGGDAIAGGASSKAGLVIGAGIGAAAAPVVVSALQSGISAGIGGGVLGAGIALAVKGDGAIQAAGADVGKRFAAGMQRVAVQAFRTPVLEGVDRMDAASQRITARMGKAFASLADEVLPLTDSLIRGTEGIADAIADSAENSGPALRGLGQSYELLADGAGDFLRILSDGSPEAADNLRLVAGATADVARTSATTLNTIGKMSNDPWLTGPLLPLLRKHYRDAAEAQDELVEGADGSGFRDMTAGAVEMAEALEAAEEAAQDLLGANRDLYGSQVDAAEAIADATEKIKENGEGLSLNTEKGQENREALSQLANRLSANYDAYVKVNGAGAAAQGVLQRNREAFIRLAEKAGYSAGQARRLANELLGIPKKITPTVNVSGTASAMSKLQALKNRLASIKDRTVYVRVAHIEGRKLKVEDQLGRSSYREYGGPVRKGHAYVVGEKRAEVFVPDQDGKVLPSIEQYQRGGGLAHGMPGPGRWAAAPQRQQVEITWNIVGAEGRIKDLLLYMLRSTNFGNA
jgi:ABC-type transporter Mla subunit MlaD